ncbi:SRPBCC family protein [Nocardia sp. NBC_00416]|uniref:SRPBCC family protein n=1 Tax=Nocardia sp. NBC_00416 TaxID=2975991 RepID=UPI002E21E67E
MATKAAGDITRKVGKSASGAASGARGAAAKTGKKVEESTPTGQLQHSLQGLAATIAGRAVSGISDRVSGTAERLNHVAEGSGDGNLLSALTGAEKLAEGKSPLSAAMSAGVDKIGHSVKEKFQDAKQALTGGKGKSSGGKKLKVTNIVEQIDVGVPVDLAYDQWTQFADFPKIMKKVETVDQVSDEKLEWSGKVFWSKRSWQSTIFEQIPFERIVWRSKGDKGFIDGAVTFHEITPDLTRIIVILEYHPGGFFEKTANLWRAAGRRVRLELKLFQRHLMTEGVLHPDDIVGWHGEIRDKEVVVDDETARREEQDETEADEGESEDEDSQDEEESSEDEEEDGGAEEDSEEADDDDEVPDDEREADEESAPRRRPATRRRGAAGSRSAAGRGPRT